MPGSRVFDSDDQFPLEMHRDRVGKSRITTHLERERIVVEENAGRRWQSDERKRQPAQRVCVQPKETELLQRAQLIAQRRQPVAEQLAGGQPAKRPCATHRQLCEFRQLADTCGQSDELVARNLREECQRFGAPPRQHTKRPSSAVSCPMAAGSTDSLLLLSCAASEPSN